jgi:hypothetical protein
MPADATRDDFLIYRRSFLHELGHVARREVFSIQQRDGFKSGTRRWFCLNAIEDSAQERDMARANPGDRIALTEGNDALLARMVTQLAKQPAPGPEITDEQLDHARKVSALSALILKSSSDWCTQSGKWADAMLDVRDRTLPGTRALWDELESEGWAERVRTVGNCENVARLADELFRRLWPDEPPEQSEEQQQQESEALGNVIPWRLLMTSDHAEGDDRDREPHPSRVDWDGKTCRNTVAWYPHETVTRTKAAGVQPDTHPSDALAQEIRRLLQSLARVRWRPEKLHGRLDKRNLSRVAMPRVGDGTWNRSIFKQRDPVFTLDAAVTLLVDTSGSMAGDKYAAAANASTALYQLFSRSLRVPTEVIGFTTGHHSGPGGHHPAYFVHKAFAERIVRPDMIYGRMLATAQYMSGNADGDAVMYALSRIERRRESRRIIVVLSDGSPTESYSCDADSALQQAIATARKTRGVEVYGIGIMDTNVRRYYSPQAPIIRRPSEIAPALITALRDILQRK